MTTAMKVEPLTREGRARASGVLDTTVGFAGHVARNQGDLRLVEGLRDFVRRYEATVRALESDLDAERQTSTRLGEALEASEQLVADLETALREIAALGDEGDAFYVAEKGPMIARTALGETDG